MRTVFHGELDELGRELAVLAGLVAGAMERAVHAVLEPDLAEAQEVVAADAGLDVLRDRCEEHAELLLSLQAPVARDLRLVVSSLQVAEKIRRMGGLARHVAEVAVRRYPARAVPDDMVERIGEMGHCAVHAARIVADVVAAPQEAHFAEQERADDRVDALQREVLTAVHRADAGYTVQDGIDLALLARFVERFADQAVGVTKRLDYIVTGALPGR